jgi:phage-related protein
MAFKGAKQIVVTIGKTAFNVIIYGAAVVYLIGKTAYKVAAAASNAIFKFLAATGKAVISAATAVGDAVLTGLKAAGVAIEKGAQAVTAWLGSLKDQTIAIVKWVVNLFKQFGNAVWGKVLIAAGAIQEFSAYLGTWLKDSYNTVAKEVGLAWDQAMNLAKQGVNALKQGLSTAAQNAKNVVNKVGNKISSTASNIGNSIANTAGKAAGWIKGFLSEMLERYYSMENYTTNQILSECVKYNGKVIL